MKFYGYRRPDGRVGVRNKILILPASMCSSDVCRIVASRVEGAVSFNNQVGCAQVPSDAKLAMSMMSGMAANPNIYGTILIGLGCETCQVADIAAIIHQRTNKPLRMMTIQGEGGTLRTVEKAVRWAKEMVKESSMLQKEEFPISELVLATECGGSDPTSGLVANPGIGNMSDKLVGMGGTSILSETTEFVGAEHILAARAKDERVHQRILDIVARYERHFVVNGENVRDGNPTPGNKDGGLTTLEEKSLGCIHKGGESIIQEVFDYGEQVTCKGLVIMDTPGNDSSSLAGMAAGGAQVAVFSTGRGTALGNAIMPTIKITANRETYQNMSDDIDFDASGAIFDGVSIDQLGDDLLKLVVDTASGRFTNAEILGYNETSTMRACNFV